MAYLGVEMFSSAIKIIIESFTKCQVYENLFISWQKSTVVFTCEYQWWLYSVFSGVYLGRFHGLCAVTACRWVTVNVSGNTLSVLRWQVKTLAMEEVHGGNRWETGKCKHGQMVRWKTCKLCYVWCEAELLVAPKWKCSRYTWYTSEILPSRSKIKYVDGSCWPCTAAGWRKLEQWNSAILFIHLAKPQK